MKGAALIVLTERNWWWGARPVFGAFLAVTLLVHITNRSASDAIVGQWFWLLCALAAFFLLWRRKVCYYPAKGRLTVEYGFPFASLRRRYKIGAFERVALVKTTSHPMMPELGDYYVWSRRIVLDGTSRVTLRRICEPQTAEYFACATAILTGLPLYRSDWYGELHPGTIAGRDATLRRGLESGEARGLYHLSSLTALSIGYAIPAAGVLVAGWPVGELFVLLWLEVWMLGLLGVADVVYAEVQPDRPRGWFFWGAAFGIGLGFLSAAMLAIAPAMLFPVGEDLDWTWTPKALFATVTGLMGGKGLWLPMAALFASHVSPYLSWGRGRPVDLAIRAAPIEMRRVMTFFFASLFISVLYRYFFGVDAAGALMIVLSARVLVELYLHRLEHWQHLEAREVLALTGTIDH